MPATCQVLGNTNVNQTNTLVFGELTILRERDEGGLSRDAEFCWAEREVEGRAGHFMGKGPQSPSLEWGGCGAW